MVEESVDRSLAESPEAWRSTAVGLKRAAELIWAQWYGHPSPLKGDGRVGLSAQDAGDLALLLPSFLLLLGLAFENLLKGVVVAEDPSRVRQGVRWRVPKGGHDLKGLCAAAGILTSTDELSILEALTEATLWAGRYPVPKHHGGRMTHIVPLGWRPGPLDVDTVGERFAEYKSICDRLFSRIHDEYPRRGARPGV